MQITFERLSGYLVGLAIGGVGYGLDGILHGNANVVTISMTVVGAIIGVYLIVWYLRIRRKIKNEEIKQNHEVAQATKTVVKKHGPSSDCEKSQEDQSCK